MRISVDRTAKLMGERAATATALILNQAIEEKGHARLLLSTGTSQLEMFDALVGKKVCWECVTMFHLDEYISLPKTHPASFRKYLKERFIDEVHPKEYFFVNGEGDIQHNIAVLTAELRKEPIDVGLIGIGENGHIAFNDPPADFACGEAYHIVTLDDRCKHQQMGEGWFLTLEDVPNQAISMTPYQIMQCREVISVVPGMRKAEAIKKTLEAPVTTPMIPATLLREHPAWTLFLDTESASMVDKQLLER